MTPADPLDVKLGRAPGDRDHHGAPVFLRSWVEGPTGECGCCGRARVREETHHCRRCSRELCLLCVVPSGFGSCLLCPDCAGTDR